MNVTIIHQGISYVVNNKGEKTALQLDLTNPAVKEIVEDLMDTLDVVERRNEPTRSFEDVKNEILGLD
jgi:crotonobetainyl-CoA:carnitine CoA-transferase CaiB-like acyl-CoA transferase